MPEAILETKLKKSHLILLNVFLVIVLFYSAELGRMLGVKGAPIAMSLVWPPAGFALAGLLIFGIWVWPSITIANFLYSFVHVYLENHQVSEGLLTGLGIAVAATLEAVLSYYIIRRYCSAEYFASIKDVLILLIPAGALVCLLGATLATLTLYLYLKPSFYMTLYVWSAFWIEDTMGIYIIVPFLIVWALHKRQIKIEDHPVHAICMSLVFIAISFLTFAWGMPGALLFIPLNLWITYVFRMRGATLATFMIATAVVIPTGLGYGALASFTIHPYFTIASFLAVLTISSLVLAALINEREDALKLSQQQSMDLESAFKSHMEGVKDIHGELHMKEKFASSLGMLTTGIAKQIQIPLKRISHLTNACVYTLQRIKDTLSTSNNDLLNTLKSQFSLIESYLENIGKHEKQADYISKIVQQQSALNSQGKLQIKSININKLLDTCLNQITAKINKLDPDFVIHIEREYDPAAEMALAFPQDLAQAFILFLNSSVQSMREKKKKLNHKYNPLLTVSTIASENHLEVIIRDNGNGVSDAVLKDYFHSFITTEPSKEEHSFDLSLAHDIIVHVHEGDIQVQSHEGEYLQVTLILPKPKKSNIKSLK